MPRQKRGGAKTVRPKGTGHPPGVIGNSDGRDSDRILENPKFESYYRTQGICPEAEWEDFIAALKESLPTSIRVNLSSHVTTRLLTQLEERLSQLTGEQLPYAPRQLPWFPRKGAWQWDRLSGPEIRSHHKRLKAFLVWLQNHGSISRQEAVSMVPPLCLDLQPGSGQIVLDLCAAPGSKSAQIVEMLHLDQEFPPAGVLIANELIPKRADVLTHNLQRLGSPCFVVTQIDAQFFPNIVDSTGAPLLFDRVLADVPCSGDGTLRKCPQLWEKWSPRDAVGLHHRQYTILCRGLNVLKPGGQLVYSTCSFNPLEDEAVVLAALLRRHSGCKVSLVPLPHLEGLDSCPGLSSWVVPNPEDACSTWSRQSEVPTELLEKLRPSLFAPLEGSEEAAEWEKHRSCCRRFLPHQSIGGGFFVAAFTKEEPSPECKEDDDAGKSMQCQSNAIDGDLGADVSVDVDSVGGVGGVDVNDTGLDSVGGVDINGGVTAESASPASPAESASAVLTEVSATKAPVKKRDQKPKPLKALSGFEVVAVDDPAWLQAATFLGLDPSLACNLRRSPDADSRFYWVSEQAGRFLASSSTVKLRINFAGVRVLEQLGHSRLNEQPMWRTTQEGLHVLLQNGLKRRISANKQFIKRLLCCKELDVSELHAAAEAGEVTGLSSLMPSSDMLAKGHPPGLVSGSIAVVLAEGEKSSDPPLAISAMLSKRTLMKYASNVEATALCESLDLEARVSELLAPKVENPDCGQADSAAAVDGGGDDDATPVASGTGSAAAVDAATAAATATATSTTTNAAAAETGASCRLM